MKKTLLDTNIILRYLVGDVREQYDLAGKLFRQAERGEVALEVLPTIVAEACFVLTSFYKKSTSEVAEAMEGFLSVPWMEAEHRAALQGMWEWYRNGQHFVDSYLLALEKYEGYDVVSFDKKLLKKRAA